MELQMARKPNRIRDMLRITQFDPKWTLPSLVDQNPMVWMVTVNGFMVDARQLPVELQEEAFRKGLIPYIPGVSTSS
jgi:hypothetical protein